ncbi:MAG: lysoplasmalogenase family protein [Pseudomonadota bacterium]
MFLMWPKEGFLPGLIAFLLAHLAYIAAFTVPVRLAARRLVFAGYGVVALLILAQLWLGVSGALRAPGRARRRVVDGVGQPARDQQVRRAAAARVAVDPGDLLARAGVHRVGAARALRSVPAPAL